MARKRRGGMRLVYGMDPWATREGEEIALVVLDHPTSLLLLQMSTARTWGEAFIGFAERLKEENQKRAESDEPHRLPDESFNLDAESEAESGLVYRLLVEAEVAAARTVADIPRERLEPLLDDHIRFESGMVDCFAA